MAILWALRLHSSDPEVFDMYLKKLSSIFWISAPIYSAQRVRCALFALLKSKKLQLYIRSRHYHVTLIDKVESTSVENVQCSASLHSCLDYSLCCRPEPDSVELLPGKMGPC